MKIINSVRITIVAPMANMTVVVESKYSLKGRLAICVTAPARIMHIAKKMLATKINT